VPNVLDAARVPAAAAHNSARYGDALKRLGTKGQRMRPRHAERLRSEMEAFEAGPYTGPWDSRMGQPLVARGDDRARLIAPWDFYRRGRVSNSEVTASGLFSGPIAFGAEQFYNEAFEPPGDWDDRPRPELDRTAAESALAGGGQPPTPQRESALAPSPAAAAPPIEARRVAENTYDAAPAPAQPAAPVLKPQVGPAASTVDAAGGEMRSGRVVRDIQRLLIANGISVGPMGDDGRLGPDTLAVIESFGISAGTDPARMLARLELYLANRKPEAGQ
jgi:hypothetical protein